MRMQIIRLIVFSEHNRLSGNRSFRQAVLTCIENPEQQFERPVGVTQCYLSPCYPALTIHS